MVGPWSRGPRGGPVFFTPTCANAFFGKRGGSARTFSIATDVSRGLNTPQYIVHRLGGFRRFIIFGGVFCTAFGPRWSFGFFDFGFVEQLGIHQWVYKCGRFGRRWCGSYSRRGVCRWNGAGLRRRVWFGGRWGLCGSGSGCVVRVVTSAQHSKKSAEYSHEKVSRVFTLDFVVLHKGNPCL